MKNATDIFAEDFNSRDELIQSLEKHSKVFENKKIKESFLAIDRKDFVPEELKIEAYEDYPLPIGHGQTISQPTTVAFMLELLDPREGESVLDVGSGSGYTTALIAHMVGEEGKVLGIEVIAELVEMGQRNLEKYNLKNAEIRASEGGVPKLRGAPFDRILVSADAPRVPEALLENLKEGGIAVIPLDGVVTKITKKEDGKIEKERYPGFMFVPFVQ